jgi:site-specific recombinase XerD
MRRHLSNSQVRQLLTAVDLRSPFGQRDYLLIMFLYQTGLRVGECSRLIATLVSREGQAFRHLDLPAMFCKGPRGRVVPLNATARYCIEEMLRFNRARGLSTAPAAPLFQNRNHCPLSIRSIQQLIKKYRVRAGLEIAATPHTLRHSHASALSASGVPSRVIQQGLGHYGASYLPWRVQRRGKRSRNDTLPVVA